MAIYLIVIGKTTTGYSAHCPDVLGCAAVGETIEETVAYYCELTGRLRILQEGVLMHEWFPPNSWIAIASVAGTRNWGTRPNSNELRALLEHQISLLRVG